MQSLDSFISLFPGFDGDIPIPAILISARPPGDEPVSDPSAGASASASKNQAGKWKGTINPTPQKMAKKATERSSSRIRIDEPAPKAHASTPPSGPRLKILIHCSKRYTHHECVSSLTTS
jgi:hypothetical protein